MMTKADGPSWLSRYLRVNAALWVVIAILLWVTPVNVPGTNLVPFGCGSAAAPTEGDLARFVCTADLETVKALALVLIIVAGVLLLISELVVTRWSLDRGLLALTVVTPLALPLLAWSVVSTFLVVGSVAADGTLIRCGTAIAPAADTISVGLCGQLTERRLNLGLGGVVLAAGILAGAVYVGRGDSAQPMGISDRGSSGRDSEDGA